MAIGSNLLALTYAFSFFGFTLIELPLLAPDTSGGDSCSGDLTAHFVGDGSELDEDYSQKSDYEGTLAVSDPIGLTEQWLVDGDLGEDRTVLRQDLSANNFYQPLLTGFQQETTVVADPSSVPGEYYFITHRMNENVGNRIIVGFDGTKVEPTCRSFELLGTEDPTQSGARAFYWRQSGANWLGHAMPSDESSTSEALDVNGLDYIVGYADDGLLTDVTARAFSVNSPTPDFEPISGIPGPESIAYAINNQMVVTGAYGDFALDDDEISGFLCKLNPTGFDCPASTLLSPNQFSSSPYAGWQVTKVFPRQVSNGDFTLGVGSFVVGRVQSAFPLPPSAGDCNESILISLGFICKPNASGECDPNNNFHLIQPSIFARSDIYNVNDSGVFAGYRPLDENGNSVGVIGLPNTSGAWDEVDLNTLNITNSRNGQALQNDYQITRALDVSNSCEILVETRDNVTGARETVLLTRGSIGPQPPTLLAASQGQYLGEIALGWSRVAGASEYRLYTAQTVNGNYGTSPFRIVPISDSDLQCSDSNDTCFYRTQILNPEFWAFFKISVVVDGQESQLSNPLLEYVRIQAPITIATDGTETNQVRLYWEYNPLHQRFTISRADLEPPFVYQELELADVSIVACPEGQANTFDIPLTAPICYTWVDTNVEVNTDYSYWVIADYYDGPGNFEVPTKLIWPYSIDTGWSASSLGLAPEFFAVEQGQSSNRIRMAWHEVAGATTYKVFRSSDVNSTKGALVEEISASSVCENGQCLYSDLGLSKNQIFYYRISAVVTAGETALSNQGFGYTKFDAPVLYATDGTYTNRVRLFWSKQANVTEVRVHRVGPNEPPDSHLTPIETLSVASLPEITCPAEENIFGVPLPAGQTCYYFDDYSVFPGEGYSYFLWVDFDGGAPEYVVTMDSPYPNTIDNGSTAVSAGGGGGGGCRSLKETQNEGPHKESFSVDVDRALCAH